MNKFIEFLYSRFLLSSGISIDTRTIQKDHLFVAISGSKFNANPFAKEALSKGALYALVDDKDYVTNDRTILVDNGLKALQQLAIFHRKNFNKPVIGITGSNGKTTTKELILKVLSKKYVVHATKGNYNNHIGVPLTLLNIDPQVQISIVEMGANHVGEIVELCQYCNPTHGLITNIGKAHTETFGGIEGVIKGKGELFDHLKANGGLPFINMDDPVLSKRSNDFKSRALYPNPDFKITESSTFLTISLNGIEKKTNLTGSYNYINIAAAIAVGRFFKVSDTHIVNAIASYKPDNGRSQIIQKGNVIIILDAYNANPDSMTVALDNLKNLSTQKKHTLAILGDMNELSDSDNEHKKILDYGKKLNISTILTLGDKIGNVANPEYHFNSKDELEKALKKMNLSNTVILLKGSRSIKMESLLKSIF